MSGIDEYSQLKILGANFRFRRLPKRQRDTSDGRARRPGVPRRWNGLGGIPGRHALPAKIEFFRRIQDLRQVSVY